jgi:hypothetical protein
VRIDFSSSRDTHRDEARAHTGDHRQGQGPLVIGERVSACPHPRGVGEVGSPSGPTRAPALRFGFSSRGGRQWEWEGLDWDDQRQLGHQLTPASGRWSVRGRAPKRMPFPFSITPTISNLVS